jgi:long-chain acyl-CoA synthetase
MRPGRYPRSVSDNPSLPDWFRRGAAQWAGRPAVHFGGRAISYQELDNASDRLAARLVEWGIRPGDRVGLYCINSDFFVISYFGILKAGATVVPINLLLNPREVAFILQDADARGLIYFEAFADAVSAARAGAPHLRVVIGIGARQSASADRSWADALQTAAPAPAPVFQVEDDVAVILYTSGTTGRPKGAMLTHHNLAANVRSCREALHLHEGEDVLLVVLPMFHSFAATVGLLLPLLHGCAIVPLPRFDPPLVAEAIARHRCTLFMGVPSMYGALLRLPAEHTAAFQSLRFCVSGGAAMPVALMEQFEKRFGKLIYEGDGPTECSPVTCVNPIEGRRKAGSVGVPIPGVEMKILDETGQEVPPGRPGEICVRGANVMKGYWQLPEETRASFFGEWFRTGDLGQCDEDGYFYIVDRIKDMIIVNGMNVYPRIIEEALYRLPAIREAAVVGEPSERHGEIPVAYLSLQPDAALTEAEVKAHCREHLGRHEVPRKVFFLPDLPKNAAGKILKRELRRKGEHERGVAPA